MPALPVITDAPDLPADGATGDDFNNPLLLFLEWMQALPGEFNAFSTAATDYLTAVLTAASTTSIAIGTGSKAFTIGTGYAFGAGSPVKITSRANVANYMEGVVASYSAGLLTVTVATSGGSGTYADWDIVPALTGGSSYQPLNANLTALASAGGIAQGTHTIPILASALLPRITNGPAQAQVETATNDVNLTVLDFDPSTTEAAQIALPMPKGWDEGTIAVQFGWLVAGGTGNVVWGARARAISDDDALDASMGTAQTVTDGVTATGDLMWTAYTAAITIAGTPAAEDLVILEVYRDAASGSDTLNSNDARLVAIRVKYTINAVDDS